MSAFFCVYCKSWLSEKEVIETVREVKHPIRPKGVLARSTR